MVVRDLDPNHQFGNGDHIACAYTTVNEGEKSEWGECAFLQNMKEGTTLPGSKIQELLPYLVDHGCKSCGSVPIDFPGSNDPANGILTVNYVSNRGGCENVCVPRPPDLEWGNIGDSWSSGVAWDIPSSYDENQDSCLRLKDAWPAQMEADRSWTTGTPKAHFRGCSGSILYDLGAADGGGQQQIGKTGTPQVIVMSSGGNNAGFGTVIEKCIYTGDGIQYNDPRDGACKQAIRGAVDYMDNRAEPYLHDTLVDLFNSPQAKSHPDFWLYVNSYVHFFNVDTDWCNTVSFSPRVIGSNQLLQKELRVQFNSQLTRFNGIYQDVVNKFQTSPGQHLGFIDLSPAWDHHRFCEPEHQAKNDQWYNPDVWLWNLQLGAYQNPDGGSPPDPTDIPTDGDFSITSGGNVLENGWRFRPFHPKTAGHKAIKDTVIARLRADKIPGTT
jgi:hypothetical protein